MNIEYCLVAGLREITKKGSNSRSSLTCLVKQQVRLAVVLLLDYISKTDGRDIRVVHPQPLIRGV